MSYIIPKLPAQNFLEQFLSPSLMEAKGYHIDPPVEGIKLDQNECPWDWPSEVKDKVLARLRDCSWNRYPSPFADELAAKIALQAGVPAECVLLGPGSNYLIGLVLQTFTKKIKGKLVIARPSFALYESHCKYEGIPFESWNLNEDLEYDVKLLPQLTKGSMVVFASPNNPVGNVLRRDELRRLLQEYPDVLWVGDEAYLEFAEESYTSLLAEHSNLMLIRTFSKTMGAAGLRLGYILAGANIIRELKKPRVPFLLNYFTLVAAAEVLDNPSIQKMFSDIVQNSIQERKRVETALLREEKRLEFVVKSSQANFLLCRWKSTELSTKVYKHLMSRGIQVRNVSGGPGLAGCLRVSIGSTSENDKLIAAFLKF
jgi:histidinol-phosphate aminotransferase